MDRLAGAKEKQEEAEAKAAAEKVVAEKEAKRGELSVEREKIAAEITETEQQASEAEAALAEVEEMESKGELDPEVANELAEIKQEALSTQKQYEELKQRLAEVEEKITALEAGSEGGAAPEAGKEEALSPEDQALLEHVDSELTEQAKTARQKVTKLEERINASERVASLTEQAKQVNAELTPIGQILSQKLAERYGTSKTIKDLWINGEAGPTLSDDEAFKGSESYLASYNEGLKKRNALAPEYRKLQETVLPQGEIAKAMESIESLRQEADRAEAMA